MTEPNINYNQLNSQWEIFLFVASSIEHSIDDVSTIPSHLFHFTTINEIRNMSANSIVDIIGVVISTSPMSTIRRRDGSKTLRKTITLKDMSGYSIDATLWGEHCDSIGQHLAEIQSSNQAPTIAVKGGRIVDLYRRTIGIVSTSNVILNPELPYSTQLKAWFSDTSFNASSPSVSRNYNNFSVKANQQNMISKLNTIQSYEKAEWVTVFGTITNINVNDFYFLSYPMSFNGMQCMKRVIYHSNDLWHCTKCSGDFSKCYYRYILKLELQDHTSRIPNVTAFDDVASQLMGITAKDLFLLSDEPDAMHEIVSRVACHHFLFTLSVKLECFNGIERYKTTLIKSEEVPYITASNLLLKDINKMSCRNEDVVQQL